MELQKRNEANKNWSFNLFWSKKNGASKKIEAKKEKTTTINVVIIVSFLEGQVTLETSFLTC